MRKGLYTRRNNDDALMSLVRDIQPDQFRSNVLALADVAKYFKLPTILTTSFEDGPNGPLMPELPAMRRSPPGGFG